MIKNILSVGFDLDNTLFKPQAKINEYIRSYACRRAAELLGQSYEKTRAAFDEQYVTLQSARQSLHAIGIENVDEIMQNSLEQEEIIPLLQKDETLEAMLKRLTMHHTLYLITTNSKDVTLKKLNALGIDRELFNPMICELETPLITRKDGSAFHYVSQSLGINFSQMLFVGDREKTDIIPAKELGIITAIVHARSSHADFELQEIYQIEEILHSIEKMKNPSDA